MTCPDTDQHVTACFYNVPLRLRVCDFVCVCVSEGICRLQKSLIDGYLGILKVTLSGAAFSTSRVCVCVRDREHVCLTETGLHMLCILKHRRIRIGAFREGFAAHIMAT